MSSPGCASRRGVRSLMCKVMCNAVLFAVAVIFVSACVSPASAQSFSTLYSFAGPDGQSPLGGLVADQDGNYYGTTESGGEFYYGTVFQVSPPTSAEGDWTETVICSFAGGLDGSSPAYRLVMDRKGNLYGETREGGNEGSGTVFILEPPKTSGANWTKRIIYLPAGAGTVFQGELMIDSSGSLYGTQFSGGNFGVGLAFKLTPGPGGKFLATTLYSFGAAPGDAEFPYGPLTMDSAGNLYGVSYSGGTTEFGTAYKLTPPASGSGSWTDSVLYSFGEGNQGCAPEGNVVLTRSGRLYGLTAGCGASGNGVFFELTPTQELPWTESVLHAFSSTDGGGSYPTLSLNVEANVFYGTSYYAGGNGAVFQITPPTGRGGPWTDTVLHTFSGGSDGGNPFGPVTRDKDGVLYGTGFTLDNPGMVFSIVP